MMVNAESGLEGRKGNVCWQLGERGRVRVLLQLQSPCPGWAPAGRAACSPGWVSQSGVTARLARAHTDVTARPSVAIGAAQHFLHCPDFSLFIVRSEHPSFLPSFDPCRAQLPPI